MQTRGRQWCPSPRPPSATPQCPHPPSPKFGGAAAALRALWPCKAQEDLAGRHAPYLLRFFRAAESSAGPFALTFQLQVASIENLEMNVKLTHGRTPRPEGLESDNDS